MCENLRCSLCLSGSPTSGLEEWRETVRCAIRTMLADSDRDPHENIDARAVARYVLEHARHFPRVGQRTEQDVVRAIQNTFSHNRAVFQSAGRRRSGLWRLRPPAREPEPATELQLLAAFCEARMLLDAVGA